MTFAGTVPVDIQFWQQSPLSTARSDPQHACDKVAAVDSSLNIGSLIHYRTLFDRVGI